MKSAQQEIEERTKLAGNNQFELLLFRLVNNTGTVSCLVSTSSRCAKCWCCRILPS